MTGYTWYVIHWTLTVAALTFAWHSGGKPERHAVLGLIIGHLLSAPASFVSDGLVMVVDVLLAAFIVTLAILHRRWWLIIAAGSFALLIAAHIGAVTDNAIMRRAYVLYRFMPGLLILGAVGFSPVERWLASEPSCAFLKARRKRLATNTCRHTG